MYEWFGNQHPDYGWKNITTEGNRMCVYVYDLANEMEKTVAHSDKYAVKAKEDEYFALVKKLLIGKVISFTCTDCDDGKHTGVCDDVEFDGCGYPGGPDVPVDVFDLGYIRLRLEGMDEAHAIDDDKIIVHLDIDPEIYRSAEKYNV